MSGKRVLTPQEAKAVQDRKDAWQGQKWMIATKEAGEVRLAGPQKVYSSDNPLMTSDIADLDIAENQGRLVIKRNPYLPEEETDYRELLKAFRAEKAAGNVSEDVADNSAELEAENQAQAKRIAELEKKLEAETKAKEKAEADAAKAAKDAKAASKGK